MEDRQKIKMLLSNALERNSLLDIYESELDNIVDLVCTDIVGIVYTLEDLENYLRHADAGSLTVAMRRKLQPLPTKDYAIFEISSAKDLIEYFYDFRFLDDDSAIRYYYNHMSEDNSNSAMSVITETHEPKELFMDNFCLYVGKDDNGNYLFIEE